MSGKHGVFRLCVDETGRISYTLTDREKMSTTIVNNMGMSGWNETGGLIKGHFCVFSETFAIAPGEEENQLKFDNKVFFLDPESNVAASPEETTEKDENQTPVSAAENQV